MPLLLWPDQDRQVWKAALAPSNPFDDLGGERASLRVHSNHRLESSYGRWLTFLGQKRDLDPNCNPARRINKQSVQDFIEELLALGNMPSTIALRLTDLLLMARLFEPAAEWSFIRNLANRIRARDTHSQNTSQALHGSDELLSLGHKLMEQAKEQSSPAKAASLFRDGLMIALLALVPLRRKNMVELRIGNELQCHDGKWQINIHGNATKTHAPINYDWPADLAPALQTYLQIHRPNLTARSYRWLTKANNQLWVALSGSGLTEMAFYDIVRKRTKAVFGTAINPHAFRKAAATTLAIHDPKHVRGAAAVLGHQSFSTTEKYYNQSGSIDAHRKYTRSLSNLRNPSPSTKA